MIGSIIIWDTARGPIPNGWQTCDGTNGTPDLRGLFVRGAFDDEDVGDVGGSAIHSHAFTGDGHAHTIVGGATIQSGANFDFHTSIDNAVGTTDDANGLPPWYKLFYIQRMS